MHEHGSAPRLHPAAPGHPTPPGTATGRIPRRGGISPGSSFSREAGHPAVSHGGTHGVLALPPDDPATTGPVSDGRGRRAAPPSDRAEARGVSRAGKSGDPAATRSASRGGRHGVTAPGDFAAARTVPRARGRDAAPTQVPALGRHLAAPPGGAARGWRALVAAEPAGPALGHRPGAPADGAVRERRALVAVRAQGRALGGSPTPPGGAAHHGGRPRFTRTPAGPPLLDRRRHDTTARLRHRHPAEFGRRLAATDTGRIFRGRGLALGRRVPYAVVARLRRRDTPLGR